MRPQRLVLLVLLLVVAATTAWWLQQPEPGLGGEPPTTVGSDAVPAANATVDATSRVDASNREPAPAAAPNDPAAAAAPTGRLVIVVRAERGTALPGCAVTAGELQGVTDRTGEAAFDLPPGRTYVAVEPPAGAALVGRNGWQTVRDGERREIVVVLAAPPSELFWCRLVAAEDGAAMADVVGTERPGNREHRSDSQGCVQFVPASEAAYLDVIVPGRVPCRVVPTPGHATPATALVVPLARGCTLRVRAVDAADAGVADVAIELAAMPWRLQQPEAGRSRGPEFHWRATTGADGWLAIADLPLDVALRVVVRAPVGLAAPPATRWTMARAAEERTVVIARPGTVRLRVTDDAGAVVEVRPVLLPADAEVPPRVLGAGIQWPIERDGDGAYRFPALEPGRWWFGIAAGGAYQSHVVVAEVLAGRTTEVELRAGAALAIAGVVLGADGAPRSLRSVDLHVDGAYADSADTDLQGRFRFDGLSPGAYSLVIGAFEGDLGLPGPVPVVAGDEAIELRMVPVAGRIAGRCVGSSDVWITACQRGRHGVIGSHCDFDGSFVLTGLAAGSWDLVAFDRGRETARLVGWLPGVQVNAGRETANLLLDLQPGAVLRPRAEDADEFVICRGADVVALDNLEAGASGEAHVLPGAWTVVFRKNGQELRRREVTVQAGESRIVDAK